MNTQQTIKPDVAPYVLSVANDGQALASTNYWDGKPAAQGLCFLTWNAGAARLLVPDDQVAWLADMRTAKYVILSSGPWPEQGGREGLELLFEDHSDSPFVLHLSAEQTDRALSGKVEFPLTVWTRAGLQLSLSGRYRRVARIPCLQEW